ncbi:MAG: hypothetical protein ACKVXR_11420 [Planctomycetota bacterium]
MDGAGSNSRGRLAYRALVIAGSVSLAAALVVRAITPAPATTPKDVVEAVPRLAEPMQLLGNGASLRVAELERWVTESRREDFKKVLEIAFSIQDCPPFLQWIEGPEGQWTERQLVALRGGTREDAFAALVLIFQLARACEWSPGILARTQHAERLGGLLQDWLRTWAEPSARDPLLSEPALAAAIVYGRVMRIAWQAPLLSKNSAPYERATTFLAGLTGLSPGGRRTRFGEALAARYSRAATKLASKNDLLEGFEEEAAAAFPNLVGDCE